MNYQGEGDKRKRILEAAVRVFSQKGFHQSKVDEIAQLADVGKGTVYEYFSSKVELFQEMFRNMMENYVENVASELKPAMLCRDKLTLIARLHIKFVIRYKELAKMTITEHAPFNNDFRKWLLEHRQERIKLIQDIMKEGMASGEFRPVDAQAAALAFIGTLVVMFPPVVFGEGDYDYEKLLEPTIDVLFRGLLA